MIKYEEIDMDYGENTYASYKYDPTGQRISKTVNGVKTNQIWDNSGNIVADNNTVYNRGLGGEIINSARGGGGSQDRVGDQYYSYNGHGDTTNLVQQSGTVLAVTASYEYDAFGNCLTNGDEAESNPFRYNGQYYDEETGLIYLRNRYYDPTIGRFTQEDPAKDGLNWYVYCGNDPVNMVDPWGLAEKNSNKVYEIGNGIEVSLAGKGYYDYLVSNIDNVTIDGRALTEDEKTLYKVGYAYKAQYMEENGLLRGANYNNDVKHFDQSELQLCWAYALAMVASATEPSLDSQDAADKYVKNLKQSMPSGKVGSDGTLIGKKVADNYREVNEQLKEYFLEKIARGPFVVYFSDGVNGHDIVITAVMEINGEVCIMGRDSNNVLTENKFIPFNDFMNYKASYTTNNGEQKTYNLHYAGVSI